MGYRAELMKLKLAMKGDAGKFCLVALHKKGTCYMTYPFKRRNQALRAIREIHIDGMDKY